MQANARAQAQAAEEARNHAAAARAGYSALADVQAGLAPQIGQTYQAAADRQAAYGKGFSGQVGGLLDKSAADANALLQANGSPQQIASQGGSVRDILYSLGGYNPASVLNAQGAAFQSAADQQPITSRGLGLDAAKAANAAGAKTGLDLRNQLADLQARRPGLLAQALNGIQQNQQQAYQTAISNQYLQSSLRKTDVGVTGIDPVTGKVAVGYGVDGNGNIVPQSSLDRKTLARATAVAKRDDGTVKALAGAHDWVEKQLKPGTAPQKVADMPIKIGMSPAVKDPGSRKIVVASAPIYAKQGGGTTHNINEAAKKPVYTQTPLPKPQFDQILRQVTGRLKTQLGRYGYKPAQIRAFAMDIVDDYYVAEIQAKKDFTAGVADENKRRGNRP